MSAIGLKKQKLLDQSYLKGKIRYCPMTGIFTWTNASKNKNKGKRAGSIMKDGYRRISLLHESYMEHRLAFLYMTGKFPDKNMLVDHINGYKSDNRFSNLRLVSHSGNNRNQPLPAKNNSGVVGVCFISSCKKWRAQITACKNKGQEIIGDYETFDEAVLARKVAEKYCGYHKNHGRKTA